MGFNLLQIFESLRKLELADQLHIYHDEYIIYHWNRNKTNLIPSLRIKGNKIEQVYYSRYVTPLIYRFINEPIEDNLTGEEGFIRDKRRYAG